MAGDFFEAVRLGVMSAPDITVLPLSDAAQAHRMLEARAVSGSLVLKPAGEI
jgi:NADPH:quinone reductase-like Zn-dependent oxidoreductase